LDQSKLDSKMNSTDKTDKKILETSIALDEDKEINTEGIKELKNHDLKSFESN